ncbi:MAG: hypothetical protein ACODAJ_11465, partial [Planctomycetota bacterium]
PLRRALDLEPYRERQVMLDTFNVEPRGWESDNVDEFRIVSTANEADAALLEEVFGTTDVVEGEGALMAHYRRSPRRAAGLRYSLSAFDLWQVSRLSFTVACSEEARLRLELVTRDRRSFLADAVRPAGPRPRVVEVAIEDFGAGQALGDAVGLWVRDVTEAERVRTGPTTLVVDSLTVHATQAGGRAARPAMVEGFEVGHAWWGEDAAVEDTGERDEPPEYALHLPARRGERSVVRGLAPYRIRGATTVRFKAKADRDATVTIGLRQDAEAPARALAEVDIAASESRRSYSVPVSAFEGLGPDGLADVQALAVRVPDRVDLWLDNVAFVREPRGPRVGSLTLGYEGLKLVHLAVPSLAALAVFIVMIFLLRMEEAHSTWQWIRDQGLARLKAKLGRAKTKTE